jgi:four helix bundle protein
MLSVQWNDCDRIRSMQHSARSKLKVSRVLSFRPWSWDRDMSLVHHRELVVWQKSIELTVQAYHLARRFPDDERFGLISQMRRAAVLVPANIAEGNGRVQRRAYANHVSIARGSLRELETLTEISLRLGYVKLDELAEFRELLDYVGRMLTKLLKRLEV